MEHQTSGGPAARSTNPILTFVSVIYLIYGGLSAGVALFSVYALIQQGAGFMLEAALLLAAMLTGGAVMLIVGALGTRGRGSWALAFLLAAVCAAGLVLSLRTGDFSFIDAAPLALSALYVLGVWLSKRKRA